MKKILLLLMLSLFLSACVTPNTLNEYAVKFVYQDKTELSTIKDDKQSKTFYYYKYPYSNRYPISTLLNDLWKSPNALKLEMEEIQQSADRIVVISGKVSDKTIFTEPLGNYNHYNTYRVIFHDPNKLFFVYVDFYEKNKEDFNSIKVGQNVVIACYYAGMTKRHRFDDDYNIIVFGWAVKIDPKDLPTTEKLKAEPTKSALEGL
ncbi:MAG: hypothetical protein LBQ37_02085 [Elusimicrobiota bacterium]|jgi:outer membrane lipoprotein-sorting protein|nr:hypothetical protein [Elusimicrobiota bacterium]